MIDVIRIGTLLALASLFVYGTFYRTHPSSAARFWLLSWISIWGAMLCYLALGSVPLAESGVVFAGTLHSVLMLAGALALTGRVGPARVIWLGVVMGTARAVGAAFGEPFVTYGLWVLGVLATEGGAAYLIFRDAARRVAPVPERVLAGVLAVYAILHVIQLWTKASDSASAATMLVIVGAWGGCAAACQGVVFVERARERARLALVESTREQGALRRRHEFDRLISRLSTDFVRLGHAELDEGLRDALRQTGEILGLDHASVQLYVDGRRVSRLTHRWRRPGVPHDLDPAALEALDRQQDVVTDEIIAVSDASKDGHGHATLPGLRSYAHAPLVVGDDHLGTVLFACFDRPRSWTANERALLSLARDLAAGAIARKRVSVALEVREAELRRAQKMEALGQLAGGVAHDFNNLLMVISGCNEMLVNTLAAEDPRLEHAGEIERAVSRAAELVEQLLLFGRRQPLEVRSFDLNQRIESLDSVLRSLIGEGAELDLRLEPGLADVRADPGQIEQVVLNLALNARDSLGDRGQVSLTTRTVEIDGRQPVSSLITMMPGRYACLTVEDTGNGMSPETLKRIFDPFFTTKAPGKGSGLGLAMVHGVVEQCGGGISVESRPDSGTRFDVYLRIASETTEEMPAHDRPAPPPRCVPVRTGGSTVLLVEDEPTVRRLARRMIEQGGYRVLDASDGVEGLARAREYDGTIDLLLTDVVMPSMGGLKLAETLRTERPDLRVLFMSGYPTRDGQVRLPHGANLVRKPFSAPLLLAKLRECLEGGRPGID